MGTTTTTGGVSIEGTTKTPTTITLSDADYVKILAIQDLTQAIKELTLKMGKR